MANLSVVATVLRAVVMDLPAAVMRHARTVSNNKARVLVVMALQEAPAVLVPVARVATALHEVKAVHVPVVMALQEVPVVHVLVVTALHEAPVAHVPVEDRWGPECLKSFW